VKRLFLSIFLFTFSALLINTAVGSAMTEYRGNYKNEHVTFNATYRSASWLFMREGRRRGGSSQTVIFKIKANEGYKILNDTNVKFKGSTNKFKAQNVVNNYYREGEISLKGVIETNDIVELEYFICKTSDDTCERYTKKLKLTIERKPQGSHDIIKIIINEA
jgi:hypothetical protein